jgi:hypothetical protein
VSNVVWFAGFWVPVGAHESGDEEAGSDEEAAAGSSSEDGADDDAMEAGSLGSDGERQKSVAHVAK